MCDPDSHAALHVSGVTARVAASPDDPDKDIIVLDNTATLDLDLWDLGLLTEQAYNLWAEREI